MLIYICFSCSEQDQLVNALFGCQRQSTLSWEPDCWVVCRICLLKVSGHFFPSLWRVCECVNSAFWSLSVIERLLARRTAEGLKRDQSPLSGPSGTFGFSFFFFFFTCGWVRAAQWRERWREKAWKVFRTHSWHARVRGRLMIFWSHQSYTWRNIHFGTCVLVFVCRRSCLCWVCTGYKSDNLKQRCPTNNPQLGQPLWFTVTSMPTE